jgi:hypothetical protein
VTRVKQPARVLDTLRVATSTGDIVSPAKEPAQVRGFFRAETRDRSGRIEHSVEGENVLTLSGREFLSQLVALSAFNPATPFRNDRLAFFGLGIGSQPEVPGVSQLVSPVAYLPGQFLAPVQAPATFPPGEARTFVTLVREYSRQEINLIPGTTVLITEAGIFTNGDPNDNWNTSGRPTDLATAGTEAPMFYKNFEPIPVNAELTFRIEWELRFV